MKAYLIKLLNGHFMITYSNKEFKVGEYCNNGNVVQVGIHEFANGCCYELKK